MKHGGHFTHQEQAPAPPAPDYTPRNVTLTQEDEDTARLEWTATDNPDHFEVEQSINAGAWESGTPGEQPGAARAAQWEPGCVPNDTLRIRIRAEEMGGDPLSEWVESETIEWA